MNRAAQNAPPCFILRGLLRAAAREARPAMVILQIRETRERGREQNRASDRGHDVPRVRMVADGADAAGDLVDGAVEAGEEGLEEVGNFVLDEILGIDTDAWRRLSLTVVSSAPRAKACVACVWRIQCGLARRSFSAVAGLSAAITSATFRKKRCMTAHSLAVVMPAALTIRPLLVGTPRCKAVNFFSRFRLKA